MDVDLFVTCMVDLFRPQVGTAAVAILERRGYHVEFPEAQTCCGQFAYNAGHHEEARAMAKHYLEAFGWRDRPIVALSGSCAAMVRQEYPRLFSEDALEYQKACETGSRVLELTQLLAKTGHFENARNIVSPLIPVALHHGCHMRRLLKSTSEPVVALRMAGMEPIALTDGDQCCGFGGTYAMSEPAVSTAIADDKLRSVAQAETHGARALVGADLGCLLHLGGRLSRLAHSTPVLHIAEAIFLADQGRLSVDELNTLDPLFGLPEKTSTT